MHAGEGDVSSRTVSDTEHSWCNHSAGWARNGKPQQMFFPKFISSIH